MEKIKINDIQLKGPANSICVVNYNDGKEATLNAKWQEQEIDYLQKDVGIGGSVKCEIVQNRQYTNITKVDFSSAEKGDLEATHEAKQGDRHTDGSEQAPVGVKGYSKEKSIIAQCLTKCWASMEAGKHNIADPAEVLKTYNYFLKNL